MKLFTFSGISASLSGTNDGAEIIDLAEKVIAALPTPSAVNYEGVDDVDHFRILMGNLPAKFKSK